jgi:hypothetical protein
MRVWKNKEGFMKNRIIQGLCFTLLFVGLINAQATSVTYTNVLGTSATISWTPSVGGISNAVFVLAGAVGTPAPVNSTTYLANTVFATPASQIGASGWYCVFNGVGTTVAITGLTAGTTYRTMVVEYTGGAGSEVYNLTTNGTNPANVTTTFAAPTTEASVVNFTATLGTKTTINWTNGNGTSRAVFVLAGAAGTPTVTDRATYTANTAFGSGSVAGAGWFCVYNGVGTSVSITGLTATTTYRAVVVEYNGGGGVEGYLNSFTTNFANVTTATPPAQATAVSFTSVTTTTTTISWTNGGGANRAVFVRSGAAGSPSPVDGTTYTANTVFSVGTEIPVGSGWYCVYNGVGTTVAITGLTAGTTYRIKVVEYNGGAGSEIYNTSDAAGNPANITTTFAAPVVQASITSFTGTLTTQTTINFADGNGSSTAVFVYAGSSGNATTTNRTTYTANTAFGGGSQAGAGWFCVYNGATGVNTVTVTGLTAGTTYRAMAVSYNGTPGAEGYNTTANGMNVLTTYLEPTTQATAISATMVSATSTTISWTNGNGSSRIVFIQATSIATTPTDRSTYAANAAYGGSVYTGTSCVYNGTGSSVTVTGLSTSTVYEVKVFEYNGIPDGQNYMTAIAAGNPLTFATPPALTAPNSSIAETVIPYFDWAADGAAGTYDLQVSIDNTFASTNAISKTLLATDYYQAVQADQLSNGMLHYWRVRVNRTSGPTTSLWSAPFSFTTITPAMPYLTYPSNGAILSGTTTSMYWYTGMVGINYNIQIAPGGDPTFLTPGAFLLNTHTTNTYYTVNNSIFTQGATYYWRVIAKTLSGVVINISNKWQFSMPGLPQVVGSYPVGGVTIYNNPPTLYWYPLGYNSKVTDYVVRVRKGSAPNQTTEDALPLSAGTQWVFRTSSINTFVTVPIALDAGGTYYWDVSSYDGTTTINAAYFTNNASPVNSFVVYGNSTFIASYPSYPTAGSTVYTTTPTLYWYTNVYSPVIYYQVQVDDETGFTAPYKADITTGITTNSYTVLSSASLATGNTYYWRVRASIDNSNWGSWSSPASFVVSTTGTAASVATPYPATPNSGTVIGVTNPTLTWYAYSADPLQFRVKWATNPAVSGGTFTTPTGTSGWMTSNSFVLSGLTAGATYYWQVQARLATTLTEGAWSTVAWFTTAAGSASVVPLAGSPINGTPINNTNATLSWILPTQSTSTLKYDVQYSKQADFSDAVTISNLDKPNVEVKNLDKNSVYYWRAASTNNSGLTSSYSAPTSFNTGKTVTAIEEKVEQLPTQFELSQNYPNPFNPTTLISYALPQNAFVTLKVYDMLGREVKTLVSKEVAAGNYSVDWNGDDNFGNKVATGAYVYRITAGDFVSVKKMLLIK